MPPATRPFFWKRSGYSSARGDDVNGEEKAGRRRREKKSKPKPPVLIPLPVLLWVYAALALLEAAASSQFTDTSFETPGSCMVTPYRTEALSMVRRLWVTTMNCASALISDTICVKRPTLV